MIDAMCLLAHRRPARCGRSLRCTDRARRCVGTGWRSGLSGRPQDALSVSRESPMCVILFCLFFQLIDLLSDSLKGSLKVWLSTQLLVTWTEGGEFVVLFKNFVVFFFSIYSFPCRIYDINLIPHKLELDESKLM